MAEEKREHDAKMKKMEAEMEQVFEMKVKEKKQKLKDSEADVSIQWLYYTWFHKISEIQKFQYFTCSETMKF